MISWQGGVEDPGPSFRHESGETVTVSPTSVNHTCQVGTQGHTVEISRYDFGNVTAGTWWLVISDADPVRNESWFTYWDIRSGRMWYGYCLMSSTGSYEMPEIWSQMSLIRSMDEHTTIRVLEWPEDHVYRHGAFG